MAAKLLLPGFGGAYVSEIFTSTSVNSVGADTLDCSRCASLAIQLNSIGSAGTGFQLQQSFNFVSLGSATWVNFGAPITAGVLFSTGWGPFGVIRVLANISAGSSIINIVGFPVPTNW